jgi:hypothetical protein
MPFGHAKILDYGTANPVVARLTLQVSEILDQCEIATEMRDEIKKIHFESLAKGLLRCWEIT